MLLHYMLVEASAAPTHRAAQGLGLTEVPGVIAVIGVTFILRVVLGWTGGKVLSAATWWDDAVRVALAFVGYAGALSTVPIVVHAVTNLYGWFIHLTRNTGFHIASYMLIAIVALILAALTGHRYYQKDEKGHMFLFIVGALPFVALPWPHAVTLWYCHDIGLPFCGWLVNQVWPWVNQLHVI